MLPYIVQNVSPAGREYLHHATQPARTTNQFLSIDVDGLEGWTLRFLTSLSDTPSWEDTVSLVNEHHQTLAHLAVLFRYTALLEKVAQWGIDLDVQDGNGFTALHCAYLCGDLASVGVLRSYGADEDIEDNLGRRPLDMYLPSTNDPGRGSPSSDCTSSSAQRPTASSEDWESVSMASSQPGSFSNHEATMDLPASRHQLLHTRELTTSSSVIPASLSVPSPTGSNSSLTVDGEMIKGVGGFSLSDSSISLERTPSFSRAPDVSGAMFQYTPQETHLIILSTCSARQTDAALPTTADMSSPQTYQADVIRQPASCALSSGESITPQSMDTGPGDIGVIVTTRPAPSPLPAVSTFTDEQARQRIESLEWYQMGELGSTSYTPREVRETLHIILSATDTRRTDVTLTTSDLSSPQPFEAGATRQPTLPRLGPPPLPETENDNRHGTQKEEDLIQLEKIILSSSWYASNTLEPASDSLDCPYIATCYGIRGMSCYSAFVTTQPVGTFGCWRCNGYSARKLEDALKHQRSVHFNHSPFLCDPEHGAVW